MAFLCTCECRNSAKTPLMTGDDNGDVAVSIVVVVASINRSFASIELVDESEIRCFQRIANALCSVSQPIRGIRASGFRHGMKNLILHAVTKAKSSFNELGVRGIAQQDGDVTMDPSLERHFCDGCLTIARA